MAVTEPCYCTREDVKLAPDFAETARGNSRIDRAIQSVSRIIERELHRFFYPIDTTYYWDWPNFQYAAPWRLWVDQWDIVALTGIESPPGTSISIADVLLYPPNRLPGWPYTRVELNRSTTAAWGPGATPQQSIALTGTFGFTADTDSAGTLAAAVLDTDTAITVSDGSQMGVGDIVIAGTERMIVSERAAVTTGLTQSGSGCSTASVADVALATTGTGTVCIGEVILLDSERMLVEDVTAGVVTVKRAWDGTVLATHTGATVYAYRQLTVLRGQLGTAAAGYSSGTALSRHRVPGPVRDLAIAEAVNRVLQEVSGYARTVGEADALRPAPGMALTELWDEVTSAYGRRARSRGV